MSLSPGLEVPTPRWRGVDAAAGPTPRPDAGAPTPWRSKVERDMAALREEVQAKAQALADVQEHCASLRAMLAALPEPAELSPRARMSWRRLQSSARGDAEGHPEHCAEELARELKTLEVQKVSSDEEISRLLQKVSEQGEELADLRRRSLDERRRSLPEEELRRASLEAERRVALEDEYVKSGVAIGAATKAREQKAAKDRERRRKEKRRSRRHSDPAAELCPLM